MLRPNIVIWEFSACEKETGNQIETYYFLFYKRARKFYYENLKDYDKYNIYISARTLWLWW